MHMIQKLSVQLIALEKNMEKRATQNPGADPSRPQNNATQLVELFARPLVYRQTQGSLEQKWIPMKPIPFDESLEGLLKRL